MSTTATAPAPVATPVPFTRELVEAGAMRAHTYESWARAVIAEALERVANDDTFDSDGMSVTGDITIRPGSTVGRDPGTNSGCIDVEFLGIHIHVEWE
jgi:hypothetical protein